MKISLLLLVVVLEFGSALAADSSAKRVYFVEPSDGATVTSGEEAAQLLSVPSAFVGKKALEQSRRLGSARIAAAIGLLADADLDVKGATGLPAEIVVEILVARLSRQTRQRAGASHR